LSLLFVIRYHHALQSVLPVLLPNPSIAPIKIGGC
jgi:hypothetical protein